MGFDQKGDIVFRVVLGEGKKWDVNEQGFDKPLASFDTAEGAASYAYELAKTKAGSKVIVDGNAAG